MTLMQLASRLQKLGLKVVKKDGGLLISFNGKTVRVDQPDEEQLRQIANKLVGRGYGKKFVEAFLGLTPMHPYIAHVFESTIGSWGDVITPEDARRLKMPPEALVEGNLLLAYAIGSEVHIRLASAVSKALERLGMRETGPARAALADAIKKAGLDEPYHIEYGPGLRGRGERFVIREGKLKDIWEQYIDELVSLGEEIFSSVEVEVADKDVISAMATLIEAGVVNADGGINMNKFRRVLEEAKRHAVPAVRS